MFEWLGAIGSIVLVDLVLSGDNALVIGAAASGLPRRQRLLAIAAGGGGAIILRVLFTIVATFLLQLPLLQAIGGAVLIYIAIHLLLDRSKERRGKARDAQANQEKAEKTEGQQPTKRFFPALMTILLADVTMSLDNVLAVGAIASGEILLLSIGLILSVGLLLLGSALIAELIGRLPWLLDAASLVLAWTAANMLLEDDRLGPVLEHLPWTQIIIPAIAIAIVLLADLFLWRHDRRQLVVKR